MAEPSTQNKVRQCSNCPGDTEYHCSSCPCDLCPQCKENHVKVLSTIDHKVVLYSDIFSFIPKQESCVLHTDMVNGAYTELYQLRNCSYCRTHRNDTERENQRKTIYITKRDALFYRPVLLTEIKADIKFCRMEFSHFQSKMLTKAERLKDRIENDIDNVLRDTYFKHRYFKQKAKLYRLLTNIQRYEQSYQQSATRPIHFLIKKSCLPQKHTVLYRSQLSITETFNKVNVVELLSKMEITKRGNRRVNHSLKLMLNPLFHQSLTVTDVDQCCHITFVTSDRVWVNDFKHNSILTNTTGDILHNLHNLCKDVFSDGLHTVNTEHELIYIDTNYNIKKMSNDMKTTTTIIKKIDSTWRPRCVYWSSFTFDLLIGMGRNQPWTGKVTRYNQTGLLTQTIQYNNTRQKMYRKPNYITENNNGDIVVSDLSGAVVVTACGGRHRFSYTGHPSGSILKPRGICTDALSHILVCDTRTNTVQMIHKDGRFLSYLLIRPTGIFTPCGLGYDVNTHRLWVGAYNNKKICVYRYITRQDAMEDPNNTTEMNEPPCKISISEAKELQEQNDISLQMIPCYTLYRTLTVTGADGCDHISCALSGTVWVSDKNNFFLTNIDGKILYQLRELCASVFSGIHTVNSESELIYINFLYDIKKIKKVSKDIETTTTIIQTKDFPWCPRCVYWSKLNADLLVGMYRDDIKTGKVIRYNQNGQLTQTIQYDNTRQELYTKPNYITENNNGDVLVSDFDAVMVTDREGRHRFSYTGHPPGSGLTPRGICTDELSHILLCDDRTNKVHIIDKNGQFLSYLLTKTQELDEPQSVSYDRYTHQLWVGSYINNRACVYNHKF